MFDPRFDIEQSDDAFDDNATRQDRIGPRRRYEESDHEMTIMRLSKEIDEKSDPRSTYYEKRLMPRLRHVAGLIKRPNVSLLLRDGDTAAREIAVQFYDLHHGKGMEMDALCVCILFVASHEDATFTHPMYISELKTAVRAIGQSKIPDWSKLVTKPQCFWQTQRATAIVSRLCNDMLVQSQGEFQVRVLRRLHSYNAERFKRAWRTVAVEDRTVVSPLELLEEGESGSYRVDKHDAHAETLAAVFMGLEHKDTKHHTKPSILCWHPDLPPSPIAGMSVPMTDQAILDHLGISSVSASAKSVCDFLANEESAACSPMDEDPREQTTQTPRERNTASPMCLRA